jgi:YVTN family beta-propeller protein
LLERRAFLVAPAIALAACRRRKSSGFDGYAFVANEEGRAVAAVDLNTFTVARHVRLDGNPTAVAAHGAGVYALTPNTGSVHEIGAMDLALGRRLQVARSAVSMAPATDGAALWVLCREPKQLARVDLPGFRVGARIPLPLEPHAFDLDADGQRGVVSYGPAGSLSLLDLAAGRAGRPIGVGTEIGEARFRLDGQQVLVANTAAGAITILSVPSGRIVVHLPLAVRPENLCFKPDGGQLFISGEGMDAVVVVYPFSTEIAETVLAGKAPGAMATSASYLFVANPQSGDVTILDMLTRRVIAAVAVGGDPGFITTTPDESYALVLNRRSGNMAVIRVAAITAKRTKSAALFTMVPVGSRPVCAVVRSV